MKLIDLNPWFVDAGGSGITDAEGNPVSHRIGVGLSCDCPCGCDSELFVHFSNPLDNGLSTVSANSSWNRTGESFDDLTLHPSIKRIGGCEWHGWLRNGEFVQS